MFPTFQPNPNPTANPVLSEIDNAHASLSPQAQQALDQAHKTLMAPMAQPTAGVQTIAPPSQSTAAPAAAPMRPMAAPGPATPTIAPPSANQQELTRLTTPPRAAGDPLAHTGADTGRSGIDQIHNPWLRVPTQIASAIGSAFFPNVAAGIPGTEMHHNVLVHQAQGHVAQEQEVQNDEAKRKLEGAQAVNQEAIPDLKAAQGELATRKQDEVERQHQADEGIKTEHQTGILRQHGYKKDETGAIVPLDYTEMSPEQQGIHDLKAAQAMQAEAAASLKKAQATNSPAIVKLAQDRLDSAQQAHQIAMQRLGLSEKQFEMRSHGTQGGEALPGAMIGDDGKPVGTAFQQNVRPTGSERNKGDMAQSAHEQLGTLKDIVSKRPDIFGPLAGRKTNFDVWLGSQDPDAQRFRAARTIAGDHLAGTFGGRSETALKALDDAIGQFKDNPKAVAAGLDQLEKGNEVFRKAGAVRTAGSKNDSAATGEVWVRDANGKLVKK